MTTKTFGKLTNDEKKALMWAWVDGETIEYFKYDYEWEIIKYPSWSRETAYRIKHTPVVKTHMVFGQWYDRSKSNLYFSERYSSESSYSITVTEIDGVIQPEALVEKL